MTQPKSLEDALAVVLPHIDRGLAEADLPVNLRPTSAALEFVARHIETVSDKGADARPPGEMTEILVSDWFALLYRAVEAWYRDRYSEAKRTPSDDRIDGVVEFAGTAFRLRVPPLVTEPAEEDDQVWIRFPRSVGPDEDTVAWIEAPPNVQHLSTAEKETLSATSRKVAADLRSIRNGIIGVAHDDPSMIGLLAGVLPRLETAARMLSSGATEQIQQAYWEMQLACENVLKALLQQQTGTFPETHDLYRLYDGAAPAPKVSRDLLKRLPRWEETMDLRYGQGVKVNRAEAVASYASALRIVAGAVDALSKVDLDAAGFKIQRPPWMREAGGPAA